MVALIDSGNRRFHVGLWDNHTLVSIEHHDYPDTKEKIGELVRNLVEGHGITRVAASSVSMKWREPLFQAIRDSVPVFRAFHTAEDVGVRVPYEWPETYGIDRALGVLSAYRRFGASCVVIDAGTALTVDAVGNDGSVAGGFIIPGFHAQSSGLFAATGLPRVSLEGEWSELGRSTEDCIRLGILGGYKATAEELVRRADHAVNAGGRLIMTGGEAALLSGGVFDRAILAPGLVLEGIGLAWERG